jgi:RNA polymerase sigma-70 factor (ECF subfamily)
MTKQLSDIEFENLIYENQSLIIKVCKFYCHSQADIDDLFQDITINLWKGLSSFKGDSKISTWIYIVSINTAISRSMKRGRNKVIYTERVPEKCFFDPEDSSDNAPLIMALYRAIDQLKPTEKAIILLHLEEKPYKDISEIIGISEINVSVKLVRIRKKLEKKIKELVNFNI